MNLTDQQLQFYIDDALAFGRLDKSKYQDQIDNLKAELEVAVAKKTSFAVSKFLQSGSWRKGTALKPREGVDIDIDLAVFLDVSEVTKTDLAKLHDLIVQILCAAYPTKSRNDFPPSKKTVGVQFHTSGLKVDLVPVVPIKTPQGYVWQPEVGGGGAFLTSVEGQLEFIRAVKEKEPRYTQTVRLAKRWRNWGEFKDVISSFALELIAAHLVRMLGPASSIEESVIRFLLYVAQSELREVLTFPGAIRSCPKIIQPVRIFDPTNNENNVTSRMTQDERLLVVANAQKALETLNYAQDVGRKGETLELWKEVFGPSFKIEE